MAIGAFFGILLFEKHRLLKYFQNTILFYLTIILVLFLLVKRIDLPYFHFEFFSVLFGIIILNFASNDKIKISLENKFLNYLGNISYGLYMFHSIGIILALSICVSLNFTSNWLIYPLSLTLTILIAAFSYEYFESFFLKFKNKFSIIISGSISKK